MLTYSSNMWVWFSLVSRYIYEIHLFRNSFGLVLVGSGCWSVHTNHLHILVTGFGGGVGGLIAGAATAAAAAMGSHHAGHHGGKYKKGFFGGGKYKRGKHSMFGGKHKRGKHGMFGGKRGKHGIFGRRKWK